MTCYHPLRAAQLRVGEKIRINPPHAESNMQIPCGKCIGCRAARAAQWGNRCTHEASCYDHNRFLTLTYDDEHLPPNGWLDKKHVSAFIKKLRKKYSNKIRFFAAGEYGSHTTRPHYHLLVFNCRFPDEKPRGERRGEPQYESALATKWWGKGQVQIGTVTGASAAYVAQYVVKGSRLPAASPEGVPAPKPFLLMSRNPGIGQPWLEQYADDLKHGYLITDGRKTAVPAYYKRKIKEVDPERHFRLKWEADDKRAAAPPQDPRRLADAETIHKARRAMKTRVS